MKIIYVCVSACVLNKVLGFFSNNGDGFLNNVFIIHLMCVLSGIKQHDMEENEYSL